MIYAINKQDDSKNTDKPQLMETNNNNWPDAVRFMETNAKWRRWQIEDLDTRLRKVYAQDTSYPRTSSEWTSENPCFGHCAPLTYNFGQIRRNP